MQTIDTQVLLKWEFLINAAKAYWVDSKPTGMSDQLFDAYELQAAREDKFNVRDYVIQTYLKGTRSKNKYIQKIQKFKVQGCTMIEAICKTAKELGISEDEMYCDLKYDGCSIALYLDPKTGIPLRLTSVGNTSFDYGVDQTWKLLKLVPKKFPTGILAIQCEALVDLERLSEAEPERARQKASGLINSKHLESEVNNLLTLRAYRYYLAPDSPLEGKSYREVLDSFPIQYSKIDGHITFAPAQTWTLSELLSMPEGFTEVDRTKTNTGKFLNDGWCLYNSHGVCQRALKFSGAGTDTEALKTVVHGIQWNDQSDKGKDSWSANVIIDPVYIKGCKIVKPSAGSVSKLIKNNITEGAEVGIILANSTIPMVGSVFSSGSGNFAWPTCECGYTLGEKDIFGSFLKCGNPLCTSRINRMRTYLKNLADLEDLDLNLLLVIDRFRWENTDIDIKTLLKLVKEGKEEDYYEYLNQYLNTSLQKRNLELVWKASYITLNERLQKDKK